jgi:hypothetical protein
MEPREYFKVVAKELEAIRAPENINTVEAIEFLWDLWERNIAPEIAAELVINHFGVGKESNVH